MPEGEQPLPDFWQSLPLLMAVDAYDVLAFQETWTDEDLRSPHPGSQPALTIGEDMIRYIPYPLSQSRGCGLPSPHHRLCKTTCFTAFSRVKNRAFL